VQISVQILVLMTLIFHPVLQVAFISKNE